MLSVYMVPIVMRPIDFLRNFRGYILGLISYLCLIPMFTNVFSIYAMSNLHDISWGNRPTTTGTEAFSANAQTQASTKIRYETYRANFLFAWLVSNGAYFVFVLRLGKTNNSQVKEINNGQITLLDGFTLYLASIVIFRVVFGFAHAFKWQFRYAFDRRYAIKEYNLEKNFKKIK